MHLDHLIGLPVINSSHLASRGVFVGTGTITCLPGVTVTTEHAGRIHIELDGQAPVPVVAIREPKPRNGWRMAFECPGCAARRRNLYVSGDVFGCRGCLPIDYRSRHGARRRHRISNAVHMIGKLRRELGADLTPFSDLPPRPRHNNSRKGYDRLAARLAVAEARALGALDDTIAKLERRREERDERRRNRPRRGNLSPAPGR